MYLYIQIFRACFSSEWGLKGAYIILLSISLSLQLICEVGYNTGSPNKLPKIQIWVSQVIVTHEHIHGLY